MDETPLYIARADELIAVAKLAAGIGDFGSAASRLYYAMFNCAEVILLTKDPQNGVLAPAQRGL